MPHETATLTTYLQDLNALLVSERQAITHLRMDQLDQIQQQKIRLLTLLQQADQTTASDSTALIQSIKTNNQRNRMLLESGLMLIGRLQDNVFRRLALTYAAHGRSLTMGAGPRLLNRSA